MKPHRYIIHARSEREAIDLAALGWRCDPGQLLTHHQEHSIRYFYVSETDPPLPPCLQRTPEAA